MNTVELATVVACAAGNKCLITGADLYVESEGKWVHGDLHREGTMFIFNAVVGEDLQPKWNYTLPSQTRLTITLPWPLDGSRPPSYFERRGVIVFSPYDAVPNAAARERLGLSPTKEGV